MRYEAKMRKLAPFCIAVVSLGVLGISLSILHFCTSWTALKAAAWITVHDWFSASYPALERDFLAASILLVYILRGAKPAGKGWRAMLRAWGKELLDRSIQASGVVLLVVIIFSIGVFLYNLHRSCAIFVRHRPKVQVSWKEQTSGFEFIWTPGGPAPEDITPEWLKDRHEYIVEFDYSKDNLVPASFAVLMQFPYALELWKTDQTKAAEARLKINSSTVPLIVGPLPQGIHIKMGNGDRHRYWVFSEPYIEPGGHIRMVIVLNTAPGVGGTTCSSDGSSPNLAGSPAGFSTSKLESHREYIHVITSFSYGNQTDKTETYAPFEGNQNSLSLGSFSEPPTGLQICSDAF